MGFRKVAAAAGLIGVFGVISISGTQMVTPNAATPPSDPDFPTLSSVGPAVDPTIAYAGDCYFDSSDDGLLIENRVVNCDTEGLRFEAGSYTVTFRESIIYGQMFTFQYTPGDAGADDYPRAPIFVVEDSDIIQTSTDNNQNRSACCSHYVIRRSYLQGYQSTIGAHNNVVIEDNYMTTTGTHSHSSGMRVLKNTVVDHNTVICRPVHPDLDGGCSAAAVYYSEALDGSSAAAFNLDITNNYFKRGLTAGGFMDVDEDGEPDTMVEPGLPGGPYNATRFVNCEARVDCVDIHFTGNQFDLGWGTDAGEFPLSYGGNTWSGNTWTDGATATSGQVR